MMFFIAIVTYVNICRTIVEIKGGGISNKKSDDEGTYELHGGGGGSRIFG
jgi:hypothetical protein